MNKILWAPTIPLLILMGCRPGPRQEEPAAATAEHEHAGGETVTRWNDTVELFFEHPFMIAGRESDPWAIHLTVLEGFRPVTRGSVTLRFTTSGGEEYLSVAESPARDGIFTPRPMLPAPGDYELTMELDSPDARTSISVGTIKAYASEDALPHAHPDEASGITFLKEQQWVIPFATAAAVKREISRAITTHGELEEAPGGIARVSAPVAGLVRAENNGNAPVPGQRVSKGDILAVLSPLDGDNAYAEHRARVERLEREVARSKRLLEAEAIPEKRLVEAEHDLEVARATLDSLGAPESGYELPIRAPISGVVESRNLAVGDRVSVDEPLFVIVDPGTLWLRAHVPADQAAIAADVLEAVFTVEGDETLYRATRKVSTGTVIDSERRTLPILFAVPNPEGRLKIGMLAEVRLLLEESVTGVAIPNVAVRDEDGVPVTYVQLEGETFARRVLRVGPSDGEWTLVESGLDPGARVVTEGAYQVRLASLDTSTIADHGHPH